VDAGLHAVSVALWDDGGAAAGGWALWLNEGWRGVGHRSNRKLIENGQESLLQNSRWSGHKALTYHHKMRMTPIEIIFLRWLHCFSRISGEITNSGQEGQNHYN
jgi:hypothetical protein